MTNATTIISGSALSTVKQTTLFVGGGTKGDTGAAGTAGTNGTNAVWTQITQAAYNALSPPDAATLYVIIG